ncbi:MAG: hypothetical protein JJT75_10400 [Opitutales bacterium]|nr:hypothetical protein [Opitutales bacterium]MCH8540727.1 hypothetical protein [Opitutales bacterium]
MMKFRIFAAFNCFLCLSAFTLFAQVDFDRLTRLIDENPELTRQLTAFNVSTNQDLAEEIVTRLSGDFPELSCNICLGALDALEELDEEIVAQLLTAIFTLHPELATQIGECVASEYEVWEPLIVGLLQDFEEVPVDDSVGVLPPFPPVSEHLPPDTVTPMDATVPSPN